MKHTIGFAAAVAVAVSAFGCAKARPLVDDPRDCPNWKKDIGPLFQNRCSQCHSAGDGGEAQGGYDTTTYSLALQTNLGPGSAGAKATLLSTLDPATAMDPHKGMADVYAETRTWLLDCRAAYEADATSVHTAGVLDPSQPDFHGTILLESGFKEFAVCQTCHGADFSGGSSQKSCLSCHKGGGGVAAGVMNPDGTPACGACHGSTPGSGKHKIHVEGGLLAKQFACTTCHPDHKSAADHAFASDGSLRTDAAQVALTGLAALTPANGTRVGPPAWDATQRTCSNVYCHGATAADTAAVTHTPNWDAAARPATQACTFCHGLPPNGAGGTTCSNCHRSVVDAQFKLVSTALHMNGAVDFADANTPCNTCHGSVTSPAPPPDLGGNSATSAVGVGQHQRHMTAPLLGIRGPIQCSECHLVPTNVLSPDHLGPGHAPGTVVRAPVFPKVTGSGTLARAQSASPVWDPAAMTCSHAYCHGGGEPLNTDKTPGVLQTPNWTTPDSGACGLTCHGTPPQFAGHPAGITRTGCVACHSKTIDATGNIILTGTPGAQSTTHMNGVFDGN